MWEKTGSILEVGAYVGKTFDNLYTARPYWDYVGVDAWELVSFPMDDPTKKNFDRTVDEPLVHSKYFAENCPYADYHVSNYETFRFTSNTFDVIILSAARIGLDFGYHYAKAIDEVKEDGIIIGRYLNHPKYGKQVQQVLNTINPENYMEENNGSMFAIW